MAGESKTSFDEISEQGEFKRTPSSFRNMVSAEEGARYPPVAGRYVLYVAWACPWASRCLASRLLKGLEDAIEVIAVEPRWGPLDLVEGGAERPPEDDGKAYMRSQETPYSWIFPEAEETATQGSNVDHVNGAKTLRQLYRKACPDYSGKFTVPVLWDKERSEIVNNESSEIIRMFNHAFNAVAKHPEVDLYPKELRTEIDALNEWMYNSINNGVYRCGFARKQEAYDKAFQELFDALEEGERKLSQRRFLAGSRFTEADLRLFVTLVRFDAVYVVHFKCNKKMIREYPNLSNWLRDVYQLGRMSESVSMQQIKEHYYGSHPTLNPYLIVPKGPEQDFTLPHDRLRLGDRDPFLQ